MPQSPVTGVQEQQGPCAAVRAPRVFHLHNAVAPPAFALFEALAEKWDFSVFYCKRKPNMKLWDTSVGGHRFRASVLPHIGFGPLVLNFGLIKALFAGRNYDVYMFAENLPNLVSILIVLAAARIRSKPLVMWTAVIETEWDLRQKGRMRRWLEQRLRSFWCRQIDAAVALSEPARALLQRHGVPASRIYRTAYYADAPEPGISRDDAKHQLNLVGNVILAVGYLKRVKGYDLLIQAFKRLNSPHAVLVIAGTGPELARLRSMAGDTERIRFDGHIQGLTKELHYRAADIFVLPSLHDDWGRVVSEAISYGLPVIATNAVAAACDLIRDNGVIVPAGSVEALTAALEQLLADPPRRETMGSLSLAINREYDLEFATRGFVQAVETALGGDVRR